MDIVAPSTNPLLANNEHNEMTKPGTKGNGTGYKWLVDHVNYSSDDCLVWPLFRDPFVGRGRLGHNGKRLWAHRLMCELVNGSAPDDRPQVAHSCGNGHLGCVNPKHLSWSSQSENHKDRRRHGTAKTNPYGSRTPLTPEQVEQIRDLKGKQPQLLTARQFGISHASVRRWQKTTHRPAPPGMSKSALARRALTCRLR